MWNPAWLSTSAVVTDRELSMGSVTSGWMQWSIQKNRRGCQFVVVVQSQSHVRLYDPMDCSTLDFPVLHYPGVYSNSCPFSQWCHPTISSSVTPFSFCPQSFPASGSFPMSQLFTSGGQSIRASALASVLPKSWSELTVKMRNTNRGIGGDFRWGVIIHLQAQESGAGCDCTCGHLIPSPYLTHMRYQEGVLQIPSWIQA